MQKIECRKKDFYHASLLISRPDCNRNRSWLETLFEIAKVLDTDMSELDKIIGLLIGLAGVPAVHKSVENFPI